MDIRIATLLAFLICQVHPFILQGQADSIIISATDNTARDAWIWSFSRGRNINFGEPNTSNAGLYNVIRAETWQWNQGVHDTIRSLVHFNIPDSIKNYSLNSAILELHAYSNPRFMTSQGTMKASIFPIVESWNEAQVNWINQPAYDTAITGYFDLTNANSRDARIDVLALVNHQLQTDTEGWMLQLSDEGGQFDVLSFASSEHTQVNLRPRLILYPTPVPVQTSSEDIPIRTTIKGYPNPCTTTFTIPVSRSNCRDLTITNSSGIQFPVECMHSSDQVTISVENLPPGIYYVDFEMNGEKHYSSFLRTN